MTSASRSFEILAKDLFERLRANPDFETVLHDVQLEGKDGPRQIDILLKGKVGPYEITTIVECKDHARKLEVTFVDAIHSKAQDVNANKAVLVSTKGFTNGAIKKARLLGIGVCTIHDALVERWRFDPEIPVIVEETVLSSLNDSYDFTAIRPTPMKSPVICNGVLIRDLFFQQWNAGQIKNIEHGIPHQWQVPLPPPYFIEDINGELTPLDGISVTYETGLQFFFGYIGQLAYSKALFQIDEMKGRVFFDAPTDFNYRSNFIQIRDPGASPFKAKLSFRFSVRSDVLKTGEASYAAFEV